MEESRLHSLRLFYIAAAGAGAAAAAFCMISSLVGIKKRKNRMPSHRSCGGGGEIGAEAGTAGNGGGSMMEQLVPEITTHALSYLDHTSLCSLSMTNSAMRRAANDDNAWKALYHKDFTLEQDDLTPTNGWKSYYAATKAIINVNAEFFQIIRERSLPAMGHFWLHANYVKCIHSSGELNMGFNAVMNSWAAAFNWGHGVTLQIRDVRARVSGDMAWVTMKAYINLDSDLFFMTNVYEFHEGRWHLVHHHSTLMAMDGDHAQPNGLA